MSEIKEIFLKDYTPPAFSIPNVELIFDLYEEHTIVTNIMQITKNNSNIHNLELNAIDLELQEIWLNNLLLSQERYNYKDNILTILNVPQKFKIKIINKIYPHTNTELEGLYKSGSIFCTQNEPEGFRRITPYLDRPDVMSIFKTTVIADKKKYPILLSNGNKIQCHDTLEQRHGVTWFDPFPKPSYLFALVAGDLGVVHDTFTTKSSKNIELNIYCDLGNESKCTYAMQSLKDAMIWDEKEYNREYDLDYYNIVAVDSFNMGAMENKGLNIFNSHYVLADKDTATDENFMGIQSVIAHEYFHNWTGNRITCQSWFELTLKEGLTVFRDQCFSADMNSKEVQRIKDIKALRQRQFVEDASPTAHPIQPKSYISMNNFYTATVYEKGAEVIRMLHTLLGDLKFKEAMQIYFHTFDAKAVRIQEFLWAMAQVSEIDLKQFENWYHQSGTPTLIVEEIYANNTLTLKCTQKIPNNINNQPQSPYFFPLKIALYTQDAKEIEEKILLIKNEVEEFHFKNLTSKPILSLNRDFSAPIIIEQPKVDNPFLMKYDTNSFTRYEATQNYAIQVLQNMIEGKEIDPLFIESYGYLLDLNIDLSYKSLLLELPSITTLMQTQNNIDFEQLHLVKEKLAYKLATIYREKLFTLYKQYQPNSQENRTFLTRILYLLEALKTQEVIEIAQIQYDKALTMTEKIPALRILENLSQNNTQLEHFYNNYKNDTLVMSKYFQIIASSSKENLLDRVKQSENNPHFNKEIPNLVRALLGTFTQNTKYFHAKDGSGYKYIADKILEIDPINAQMASSLCSSFKILSKINKTNKSLMEKELNRVKSTHSLSENSLEIINKILKKDT